MKAPHVPASGHSQTTAHSLLNNFINLSAHQHTHHDVPEASQAKREDIFEQADFGGCRSLRQSALSIPCISTIVTGCFLILQMLTGPLCLQSKPGPAKASSIPLIVLAIQSRQGC